MAELRALAKARGLRGDTKAELVEQLLLSGAASLAYSAPPQPPAPPAAVPGGADAMTQLLEKMPLPQLRELARERGSRSSTRADILRDLRLIMAGQPLPKPPPPPAPVIPPPSPSPAPPASPPVAIPVVSAPAPAPPAAAAGAGGEAGAREKELLGLGLAELRQMARAQGVRGDTKAQIVSALLAQQAATPVKAKPPSPPPAAPAAAASPAPTVAKPAPKPAAPKPAAPKPAAAKAAGEKAAGEKGEKGEVERALEAMDMGELRYLARERGLKGDTKEELVKALAEAPGMGNVSEGLGADGSTVNLGAAPHGQAPQHFPCAACTPHLPCHPPQLTTPSPALLHHPCPCTTHSPPTPLAAPHPPSPLVAQARVELASETAVLLQSLLAAESSSLSELQALVPLIAPDLDAATRADRAAMFCQAVPPASRSPQADRFCNAVSAVRGGQ
ncbi:unnamed protein product [Closterium sp. Yama58-4]|nr:unnamed protein product [Closterium sp. Yama58-4]